MAKMRWEKQRKFRHGSTSLQAESERTDMADRWLRKNEQRILQERATERLERLADASIPWERLEAF